jgi:hypothetical protein
MQDEGIFANSEEYAARMLALETVRHWFDILPNAPYSFLSLPVQWMSLNPAGRLRHYEGACPR